MGVGTGEERETRMKEGRERKCRRGEEKKSRLGKIMELVGLREVIKYEVYSKNLYSYPVP